MFHVSVLASGCASLGIPDSTCIIPTRPKVSLSSSEGRGKVLIVEFRFKIASSTVSAAGRSWLMFQSARRFTHIGCLVYPWQ